MSGADWNALARQGAQAAMKARARHGRGEVLSALREEHDRCRSRVVALYDALMHVAAELGEDGADAIRDEATTLLREALATLRGADALATCLSPAPRAKGGGVTMSNEKFDVHAKRAEWIEEAKVTMLVDPLAGVWSLQAEDGTVVANGVAKRNDDDRFTFRVPLAYDPSVYFDSLTDRRRALLRGDQLREALRAIVDAKRVAEARDLARAALASPLELDVAAERRAEGEEV